jgi:hypothetical protein
LNFFNKLIGAPVNSIATRPRAIRPRRLQPEAEETGGDRDSFEFSGSSSDFSPQS